MLAYNGTRYLAVAPSGINSRAAVSVDGVNFTGASTALGAACAMTHLPISRLYTVGGKFIAFGYDTTGNIAILTSTDASAWSLAATYRLPLPAGCTIQLVGQTGIEEGGMLHVPVILRRDTAYLPTILSTSDGIAWRLHAHGYELATAPAYCELMLQPNGRLLVCGAPIETDVDNGLELYYEL
ncbi:hypothetical protein [Acidovorax radicis]|uniref:hypothetical protein n=1 Tax=Acidovorax radicis TaxID=758826 RepID=UPI001CFB01AC|nr:hypothetical protein [Acidovorax radicis]UCV00715.1 hypothetical protein KI609_08175 [Acidovorax radicis]